MVYDLEARLVGIMIEGSHIGKVVETQVRRVAQELTDLHQARKSDKKRHFVAKCQCLFNGLRIKLPKLLQSNILFQVDRHRTLGSAISSQSSVLANSVLTHVCDEPELASGFTWRQESGKRPELEQKNLSG